MGGAGSLSDDNARYDGVVVEGVFGAPYLLRKYVRVCMCACTHVGARACASTCVPVCVWGGGCAQADVSVPGFQFFSSAPCKFWCFRWVFFRLSRAMPCHRDVVTTAASLQVPHSTTSPPQAPPCSALIVHPERPRPPPLSTPPTSPRGPDLARRKVEVEMRAAQRLHVLDAQIVRRQEEVGRARDTTSVPRVVAVTHEPETRAKH